MAIIAHAVIGTPAISRTISRDFDSLRRCEDFRALRPDCEPMTSAIWRARPSPKGSTCQILPGYRFHCDCGLALRIDWQLSQRGIGSVRSWWRLVVPLVLWLLLASIPCPVGLTPAGWRYHALFVGVVVALILEPLPAPAVGLVGVTMATSLGYVSPNPAESIKWGLSGFSDPSVWLIFGALVFSTGYEKTGLGRRIALSLVGFMGKSTLGLGYAVMLADLLLAPFTPSNTGRSAGVIYPDPSGHPRPLRITAGTDRASGRRLPDVDGLRVHRRHQLALPDRPGAEPARGRDHPPRDRDRYHLVPVVAGHPARRRPPDRALAAARTSALPARSPHERGSPRMGGGGAPRDGQADVQGRRDGSAGPGGALPLGARW